MADEKQAPQATEAQKEAPAPTGDLDITVKSGAKSDKPSRECTVTKNFGSSLADAVRLFGEPVVFSIFRAQAVIKLQAAVRGVLEKADKSIADAVAVGEAWKPGVVRVGGGPKKNPMQALLEQVKTGKLSKQDLRSELERQLAALTVEADDEAAKDEEG